MSVFWGCLVEVTARVVFNVHLQHQSILGVEQDIESEWGMTGSALCTRYCSVKVAGGSPGSNPMVMGAFKVMESY